MDLGTERGRRPSIPGITERGQAVGTGGRTLDFLLSSNSGTTCLPPPPTPATFLKEDGKGGYRDKTKGLQARLG